jgi:NAD(P)-dependent dehydrogenase (short-subunit alcohol dehydrogenase family)
MRVRGVARIRSRGSRLRTVNVLSPSIVNTACLRAFTKEFREYLISLVPRGKMGCPEEVASAALFLVSSDSSFVTGSELLVDGGATQI